MKTKRKLRVLIIIKTMKKNYQYEKIGKLKNKTNEKTKFICEIENYSVYNFFLFILFVIDQ